MLLFFYQLDLKSYKYYANIYSFILLTVNRYALKKVKL